MRRKLVIALLFVLGAAGAAFAHHGWSGYDAHKKFTIEAPIDMVKWENPHAHVMLRFEDAIWEVTLAPITRMQIRGLSEDMLKAGTVIAAEGYPSTRREHEMRAERITVGGKVFELR